MATPTVPPLPEVSYTSPPHQKSSFLETSGALALGKKIKCHNIYTYRHILINLM